MISIAKSIGFFLLLSLLSCQNKNNFSPITIQGDAFGTTFHITYFDSSRRNFSKQIDSLFYIINKSMSTYQSTSDISKINRGDRTVVVDSYFKEVFDKSARIFKETHGVFDPTIGVLVNAWGFGPIKSKKKPDSIKVRRLLKLVGFEKVQLKNDRIVKKYDSIYFDFNAIAKGYAADIVGRFFEKQNVSNYLIEIGGDIRARGEHLKKKMQWKVGIENPNFNGLRSIQKVIVLKNKTMATSGNYRKYKLDSLTGQKYAHILNTKTGYSSRTNLLSVSIISSLDLADVDGYATALMAMSLSQAKDFLEAFKELDGYIIYSDSLGRLKTFSTLPNN